MKIDLHVHTRSFSACSGIEPEQLPEQAREVGLDGLVLTEHGILWPEEKLAPLRERAWELGVLILSGQEITCVDRGRRQDFLVFGVNHSLGYFPTPHKLIERVHGEGGVVVAAHPFKPSRFGVGYHGIGEAMLDLDLDGVEYHHPDHDQAARDKVRAAAEEMKIPMTGGSDAHEIFRLGDFSTHFFHPIHTVEDLVREIKAGRLEPRNGCPSAR
ncbi:MAG: PHP-associated domain-containing protein [Pseudomonadota bacterium]